MQPLPIDEALPTIAAALRDHALAVVTAPPGAGKSTRIPPRLLDPAGDCGVTGSVVLLQPRRVAAVSLARRIADEQGWVLGREVGYRIRFEREGGAATRLWVQTEGTLTRQLQGDPYLEGVGAVVLDEFHERSIHADLALAWVRELQRSVRPDLRLVVMSATMDAAPLAVFLDHAPVIDAGAAPHPVRTVWRPAKGRERTAEHAARVVLEAQAQADAGDVLVFLPGVGEIRACADLLAADAGCEVRPLHGSLPPAEQERALAPADRPKVVLATNVAETSLTVPGVRTVVDSGLARVAHVDPGTGLDELRLERISRFSAEQRAGRAGRTAPGRCYRLWSQLEHGRLATSLAPELRRCDIAPLVLVLKQLHGPDLATFPWFEPPEPERLAQAEALLALLGMTTGVAGGLTGLGRLAADLPVHPRLGRLLVEAASHEAVELGATVAALLSERDLRPVRSTDPVAEGPADCLDRLERFARARSDGFRGSLRHQGIDAGAARQVARAVDQLQAAGRRLGSGSGLDRAAELVPRLVLAAWPDRVARRGSATTNTAKLVGGNGIVIDENSALYARPGRERALLLVAHAVQGLRRAGAARSVLRMGAEIDEALIEAVLPGSIQRVEQLRYDPARDRVQAAVVTRYADLDLRYRDGVAASPEAVTNCLAEALAPQAPGLLAADERVGPWLARYRWLAGIDPALPALDDEVLVALVRDRCAGCRSRAEVLAQDLLGCLQGGLDRDLVQRVEREAPAEIALPGGRRRRIDYGGERPRLSLRVQEAFGWRESPRIAGGREVLQLELLAPNRRPVQLTDDLASFWSSTYARVRKDLRGRYPKHDWPEDPLAAGPTQQ